ncbi:Zinc finger homeobox protein [Heracleum sosnowskyi]|uniref:Zinc finger homeobox protein n=1 Tax=Heracleum sosnowskyi TaxID=360622 RepID=A0AAD8ICP8_9APIA|nr:Zinc finger homeobox protein [Heracleum sosnowskyi]
MDSYFSGNTSTSSSSTNHFSRAQEAQPSYHSALHSIRRPLQPKLMTKKPIAPLPPTPPKIYQVEPSNFKEVVQKLTSIPECQPRRLKDMAPPPLNLLQSTSTAISNDHDIYSDITKDDFVTLPTTSFSDHFGTLTPTLSPATLAWCSFLIQSPGNVSNLEQGTVL